VDLQLAPIRNEAGNINRRRASPSTRVCSSSAATPGPPVADPVHVSGGLPARRRRASYSSRMSPSLQPLVEPDTGMATTLRHEGGGGPARSRHDLAADSPLSNMSSTILGRRRLP